MPLSATTVVSIFCLSLYSPALLDSPTVATTCVRIVHCCCLLHPLSQSLSTASVGFAYGSGFLRSWLLQRLQLVVAAIYHAREPLFSSLHLLADFFPGPNWNFWVNLVTYLIIWRLSVQVELKINPYKYSVWELSTLILCIGAQFLSVFPIDYISVLFYQHPIKIRGKSNPSLKWTLI